MEIKNYTCRIIKGKKMFTNHAVICYNFPYEPT